MHERTRSIRSRPRRTGVAAGAALALSAAGLAAVLAPAANAAAPVTLTTHCVLPAGLGEGEGPQDVTVELTPAVVAPGGSVHAKITLGPGSTANATGAAQAPTTPSIDLVMRGGATGTVTVTGPEVPLDSAPGVVPMIPPYEGDFTVPAEANGPIEFTVGRLVTSVRTDTDPQQTVCAVVAGGDLAAAAVTADVNAPPTPTPTPSTPATPTSPGRPTAPSTWTPPTTPTQPSDPAASPTADPTGSAPGTATGTPPATGGATSAPATPAAGGTPSTQAAAPPAKAPAQVPASPARAPLAADGTGPGAQPAAVQLPPTLAMAQNGGAIDFGTVALNGQAQTVNGTLNQVTVTDGRGTNLGWSLTGTMSDLLSANGTDKIPAGNIGWTPSCAAQEGSLSQVANGPAGQLGAVPTTLCSQAASEQTTGGVFTADAGMTLTTPQFTASGGYTGTLTLTLI
ncbi:hypothetical protein GCM10023205_59770 [Yinghuangia aomiensis]|uniref:WxL domain surface cell wall-binding n=1 Tax=Yinghuangia aomiensis TaxID=676205 RepID=A0ABP9HZA8_9ACTN